MILMLDLFIGCIGLGYVLYGKKSTDFLYLIFGLIIGIYPFFISNIILSVVIGIILIAAPVLIHKFY